MSRFSRYPFSIGEMLTLKKPHPCGTNRWEVLRVGAEIRLRCTGCAHVQILPRRKLEGAVTRIHPPQDPERSPDA